MKIRRALTVVAAASALAAAVLTVGGSAAASVAPTKAATAASAIDKYYPTIREAAGATLPGYTVYRPATNDVQHLPVVIWGNGGCRTSNEEFQTFLEQVAAHGFYVVAIGAFNARYTPNAAPDADFTPAALVKVITWVTKRHGHDSRDQADPTKIAVAGQSCGARMALGAGADSQVDSVLSFNGASDFAAPVPAVINALHSPTMLVTGGVTDVSYNSSHADYKLFKSTVPVVQVDNSAAGHIGIFHGTNDPNAAKAGAPDLYQDVEVQGANLAINWFDYTLNGNKAASPYFLGKSCGICHEAYWTVNSKNFIGFTPSPQRKTN